MTRLLWTGRYIYVLLSFVVGWASNSGRCAWLLVSPRRPLGGGRGGWILFNWSPIPNLWYVAQYGIKRQLETKFTSPLYIFYIHLTCIIPTQHQQHTHPHTHISNHKTNTPLTHHYTHWTHKGTMSQLVWTRLLNKGEAMRNGSPPHGVASRR